MLEKTARKLIMINALVFVFVLSVFSITVYLFVSERLDSEQHEDLRMLSNALVSSIEAPGETDVIPDVMQESIRENNPENKKASKEKTPQSLEWFDASSKLVAQKGNLKITTPFDKSATFQMQQNPRLMLLTRPAQRQGQIVGYLRIGMPINDTEEYKQGLFWGLLFGTALAVVVSAIAVLWLVRQALKPIEVSMRTLSDFTGDASHELKSPITAIKTNGAVALKYSEGMRESDRTSISTMIAAANQMSRTIDDLLSLAESEHEYTKQEFLSLNIKVLVGEVIDGLSAMAENKGIKIDFKIEEPGISIRARQTDLELVLINVIKNAIIYSEQNSLVFVEASRSGNKVKIKIEDKGVGIGKEDLPKIFDRFWRSDKARSYKSGGNGLGLSIVKSILDRYRATAKVESRLGDGTVFTILWPINDI